MVGNNVLQAAMLSGEQPPTVVGHKAHAHLSPPAHPNSNTNKQDKEDRQRESKTQKYRKQKHERAKTKLQQNQKEGKRRNGTERDGRTEAITPAGAGYGYAATATAAAEAAKALSWESEKDVKVSVPKYRQVMRRLRHTAEQGPARPSMTKETHATNTEQESTLKMKRQTEASTKMDKQKNKMITYSIEKA